MYIHIYIYFLFEADNFGIIQYLFLKVNIHCAKL
jgi:hypothetical protein